MRLESSRHEELAAGILEALEYFGLFRYPLLPREIHRFHRIRCTYEEVLATLASLAERDMVNCSIDGFYSREAQESWSSRRKTGNEKALGLLTRSVHFTRIISSFPFVDAIAISGSLSKDYAGDDADIDYFIVTTGNRLWIARSLLHLFKKLTFIPGYQHYFCMNYFVDTDEMLLTDRNIYTAIELATLIPVYHPERIRQVKEMNSWLIAYLPNETNLQELTYLSPAGKQSLKKLVERMINLAWPERLNNFLMNLTDRKWRRKWDRRRFPMETYDQAFYTSLHVSKNHPANFQQQVLTALENKSGPTGIQP